MAEIKIAPADLRVGDVVRYWVASSHRHSGHFTGSALRITRPAKNAGDFLAVRLDPEPWERAGQEWLIYHRQITDGRYAVLDDGEIAAEIQAAETRRPDVTQGTTGAPATSRPAVRAESPQ